MTLFLNDQSALSFCSDPELSPPRVSGQPLFNSVTKTSPFIFYKGILLHANVCWCMLIVPRLTSSPMLWMLGPCHIGIAFTFVWIISAFKLCFLSMTPFKIQGQQTRVELLVCNIIKLNYDINTMRAINPRGRVFWWTFIRWLKVSCGIQNIFWKY